jgi:hypothetical protein
MAVVRGLGWLWHLVCVKLRNRTSEEGSLAADIPLPSEAADCPVELWFVPPVSKKYWEKPIAISNHATVPFFILSSLS